MAGVGGAGHDGGASAALLEGTVKGLVQRKDGDAKGCPRRAASVKSFAANPGTIFRVRTRWHEARGWERAPRREPRSCARRWRCALEPRGIGSPRTWRQPAFFTRGLRAVRCDSMTNTTRLFFPRSRTGASGPPLTHHSQSQILTRARPLANWSIDWKKRKKANSARGCEASRSPTFRASDWPSGSVPVESGTKGVNETQPPFARTG